MFLTPLDVIIAIVGDSFFDEDLEPFDELDFDIFDEENDIREIAAKVEEMTTVTADQFIVKVESTRRMWSIINLVFKEQGVLFYTFWCRTDRPDDRECAVNKAKDDGLPTDHLVGVCDQVKEGLVDSAILSIENDDKIQSLVDALRAHGLLVTKYAPDIQDLWHVKLP